MMDACKRIVTTTAATIVAVTAATMAIDVEGIGESETYPDNAIPITATITPTTTTTTPTAIESIRTISNMNEPTTSMRSNIVEDSADQYRSTTESLHGIMKTLINSVTNAATLISDDDNDDDDVANGFGQSSFTSTSSKPDDTIQQTTSASPSTSISSASIIGSTTAATTIATSTDKVMLNVSEMSDSLQHFGWMDYFVFVLMLVICAAIGFYFGFIEKKKGHDSKSKDKNRSNELRRDSEALDYLVGGRKMKVLPVSLSLVASFVSGISLLGTSTEIYVYGTQYAFILITLALSGVISWYVFLPVFCNLQLTSTYEYFELRFDRRLRLFGSTMFVISVLLWMPISIYVPSLTFNQVAGVDIYVITPIVCVVCTIYTCIGGIKGVIWTDVLQSIVMVGSLLLVTIKGTRDLGGLAVVYERNFNSGRITMPEWTLDPTVRMSVLSVIVGGTLFKLQGICIVQPTVQRFLSLPDMKAAKKTLILFIIGLIFLLGLCVYLGILTFAAFYDCDPISTGLAKKKDQVVPYYVVQVASMYPGFTGLFVAGIFSAALSSLSTALNSLSGVILKDFIEPFRTKPLTQRQTAFILRGVVLLFGFNAIFMIKLVEKLGLVMQLSSTLNSMTAGPLLGLFMIGMCFPFVNANSALTGASLAFATLAYVAIRSQLDIAFGNLKFPTKPVSISGCTYEFDTSIFRNHTLTQQSLQSQGIGPFHHLSFLWYTALGASITILTSLLATLYFGVQDTSELDPNLLVRHLRKYIKLHKYKQVPQNKEYPQTKSVTP